jgi:Amt family ammonium transporter
MTTRNPGRKWLRAALAALALNCIVGAPRGLAADAKPAEPTLEQRVADLEAYVNNGARTPGVASRVAGPGPGHNAWMMTSSALVLFMTLPGLALFYGGLVRRKNVLSVLAQCLGIAGLVTILWWSVGYSLVFAPGTPYIGGLKYAFLRGVTSAPNLDYGAWVSHNVFAMYQLMFAIITPALIVGAIAERMKFMSVMIFVTFWMFLVYFPLAHMVWGVDGLMNGAGNAGARISALDFAGGTVVHMSSGWSALVLCIILGRRIGFGREHMPPHSLVLCMVGTAMLWVGWYGFNAGSALGSDGIAANAFMTTTLATAVGSFTWGALEYVIKKHASILGFCSGAVAGLVVITPATGYVSATGAVVIGLFAGAIPFIFCVKLKRVFGYDDALDTFGVHAIGGTTGALLTGILASASVNPNLTSANPAARANGLAESIAAGSQWQEQVLAMVVTLALSVVATAIIGFAMKATFGLRPNTEVERQGLDVTEHGEEGYIL